VFGLEEGLVDDGGQQGLASGEVAVDGTAGHAGGLRHCAHGRVLVPCHQMAAAWVIATAMASPVRPVAVSLGECRCYRFVT
jgi:hypothetical protein